MQLLRTKALLFLSHLSQVKDVVFKKFGSISDWHPDVEKVEFDDNDPVQIGSVRKLVFYPGGGNPEYVFQEIVASFCLGRKEPQHSKD